MESLLIAGIHTRPAVFSAKRAGYKAYSVDYFGDVDLKLKADLLWSIVNQKPFQSNGRIHEQYSDQRLIELARDIEADGTILTSTLMLHRKDIIGNSPELMKKIKNKDYQLKKVRKMGIRVPRSDSVKTKWDILEKSEKYGYPFVLKPIAGGGGKGIRLIKSEEEIPEINEEHLMQEYVRGKPVSVSTLSTGREAVPLSTSIQILGSRLAGATEPFSYCGSIVPFKDDPELLEAGVKITEKFGLSGWNGVDFVYSRDNITFMEVNARFQGTLESLETAYDINVVDCHIKACQGELIESPVAKKISARLALYAKTRSLVTKNLLDQGSDIPLENSIIEQGEPFMTIRAEALSISKAIYILSGKAEAMYRNLSDF